MATQSKKKNPPNGVITPNAAQRRASHFPDWLRHEWLWGAALILALFVVYTPVWFAGFIWDDDLLITTNPCIIGPLGLKEIWTTRAADIAPLTLTTFWLEHALWGLAPLPYHLVNVLIHAVSAVLLWQILRKLQVPGAWLGAALWALHPVQTESAAWVTEMKNTESGFFYLLSIFFFLRWLKSREAEGRSRGLWDYGFTLFFAALAMAAKSSTVILPIVLILCAWWQEGRWQWRNVARVVPLFMMTLGSTALSFWTQGLHLTTVSGPYAGKSWPERLAAAGDAIWFYLGKLVWPYPLSTIYPRWQIDTGDWTSYLPSLAVLVILVILWLYRETWARPWFFAFAYFLATLLPVLGLFKNTIFVYSPVFDHFQYLGSMGPLALAGAGLIRLAKLALPARPQLRTSLFAGLLLVLAIMSWQRVWAYQSQETLWTDTLAKNPACWIAHNNLGNVFQQRGQTNEAMAQFQMALAIDPDYAAAHNNLGNTLLQNGRVDEAMTHYEKALELNPSYAEALNNLGNVLLQKGCTDEAMVDFEKALQINFYYAEAHNNLGNALEQKGLTDEAIGEYQEALKINPGFADGHSNLGVCLIQEGQYDQAITQFQEAIKINPNKANVHNNLGTVFYDQGRLDEAIAQYQEGLKIDPNAAGARCNLGNALVQKGRLDEAIAQYKLALETVPNLVDAHNDLGIALVKSGHLREAIEQFKTVVRLNPRDSNARNNLAKAEQASDYK